MPIRVVQFILCIDIFLLTLAIGINANAVVVWCMSPLSYEEYESACIGRCC